MSSLDLLGLFAGVCFAVSSIPMMISVIKTRNADCVPLSTILCVWGGSISMFVYLVLKNGLDIWVLFDYGITIVNWTIILGFKILKRRK